MLAANALVARNQLAVIVVPAAVWVRERKPTTVGTDTNRAIIGLRCNQNTVNRDRARFASGDVSKQRTQWCSFRSQSVFGAGRAAVGQFPSPL